MSYKWVKHNLKLTSDQRERGVVFSSALVKPSFGESESDTIHEVMATDENVARTIDLLRDVSWFKRFARDMGWEVHEYVRS